MYKQSFFLIDYTIGLELMKEKVKFSVHDDYDMKVKIIAEKVDNRVELLRFKTPNNKQSGTISGSEFEVTYDAGIQFLKVNIDFRQKGRMENLQKEIELKFKTEWYPKQCSSPGVDCPIIDPRNNDTKFKVYCYPEKSIQKLIFFSDTIYEYF